MDLKDPIKVGDLDAMSDEQLDTIPFGVVGMTLEGQVTRYNAAESKLAGVKKEQAIGKHFFQVIAPCTNNFLVGQRMLDEPQIDDVIPYTFTFRMQPTQVTLRLLKEKDAKSMYLFVRID